MLFRLLSTLEKVKRATTAAEMEAIQRFRYQVYVAEFKRERSGVDHERRMVIAPGDDSRFVTHFYTGTVEELTACARVDHWGPGEVPEKMFRHLSMQVVPGIERLSTGYTSKFAVRPSHRGGKLVLPALLRAGYDLLCGEKGTDLLFTTCVPGLIGMYRRVGMRPYTATLALCDAGSEIPMMSVMSDIRHLKRVGSPVTDLARKHFGRGRRAPLDPAPFNELFKAAEGPVETDHERVWQELQERFAAADSEEAPFMRRLPEDVLAQLSKSGLILDVAPDTVLTRQGVKQREMYIVLAGTFEVLRESGVRLAVLGPGDVLGEVGFFLGSGRRTADVRSLEHGRILLVRRKLLAELTRKDPAAAAALLTELARVMAERLSATNDALNEALRQDGEENS